MKQIANCILRNFPLINGKFKSLQGTILFNLGGNIFLLKLFQFEGSISSTFNNTIVLTKTMVISSSLILAVKDTVFAIWSHEFKDYSLPYLRSFFFFNLFFIRVSNTTLSSDCAIINSDRQKFLYNLKISTSKVFDDSKIVFIKFQPTEILKLQTHIMLQNSVTFLYFLHTLYTVIHIKYQFNFLIYIYYTNTNTQGYKVWRLIYHSFKQFFLGRFLFVSIANDFRTVS